ncbi:hypothetical protein Tco_1498324, partial [Tanacetum coccineum]
FDGHPPTMMGSFKNKDGIGPLIRYLWYASSLLVGNMSKYYTSNPLVIAFSSSLSSSSQELSYFLIISINITSPSSSFVQTNFVSDDRGTKPDDSRNELSLRTFFVMNEIDGSSGEGGVVLMFSGLLFSSRPSSDLLSRDLLGCLGHIAMALIKTVGSV